MNRNLDYSSAVSVNALVFSGGEVWNEDEPDARENAILLSVPGPSSGNTSKSSRSNEERSVSTYVRVFEDMICTVIRDEAHLLNDEEFALLAVFAHLSYNARFLMVKLLLRKQDTWHRLDTLKYEGELGSISAIENAIDELCQASPEVQNIVKKEESEEQSTNVTMGKGFTHLQLEQDSAVSEALEPSSKRKHVLARNEREMDLKSLLECLRVDELKAVSKLLKLRTNQKKDVLISDLLCTSSSQSTLTDFARKDGTTPIGRGYCEMELSFGKLRSQQDRVRQIVLRYIVKCVRVDENFYGVIHRVNLVYFRITQYTPNILVAALLTRFGKRAYPGYDYERTRNIWPTRQHLVDYEQVLVLEGKVDTLLSGNVPLLSDRALGSKTPIPRSLSTPMTSGNTGNSKGVNPDNEIEVPDIESDSVRVRGARMVKDIFEQVYPRWEDLVKTIGEEEGRPAGLERFHYGHVLTRIICKGSAAFGILKEYERELEILDALLAQRRWRRGRRGRWHERRAVILTAHLPKSEENTERALDVVIEAIEDIDTHTIFRPKLQRRLRKLEKKLKIPVEDRHECEDDLLDAEKVVFEATRLRHRAAGLKLDRTGRCISINTPKHGNQDIKRYYSPLPALMKPESNESVTPSPSKKSSSDIPKGKSLWLGQNGEELTVEGLALQRYEEQGFKGVHCETRIIAMLFGLLFWDIIFKPIPGAFETPYQTAPLDIADDSFYHARKDLMEKRLAAIEAGGGVNLVREADAKNRASETWCVGVRWDLFSSEDLVDIVTCIGGKALSVICRVLCEDYTFGTSGGPDLFLWNAEKGTCKFVEVKGPGDKLQGNQRVWIDILLRAPVAVEECHIVDSRDEADQKLNSRTPRSIRKMTKRVHKKERLSVDEDDADALPTTFDDPLVEYSTASTDPLPSPSNSGDFTGSTEQTTQLARAVGTSSSLKRKASPFGAASPTPSKRTRLS